MVPAGHHLVRIHFSVSPTYEQELNVHRLKFVAREEAMAWSCAEITEEMDPGLTLGSSLSLHRWGGL